MPLVPISKLRVDGGIQSRAAIDGTTVKEYAEAIKEGARRKEGPIAAYDDGESLWVASGFTWLAAERLAHGEKAKVEVAVVRGSKRDALLHSVGCNSDHGSRRSPADKRHAVALVLADEEWCGSSDNWIAERCRVSDGLVASVRAEMFPKNEGGSVSNSGNTENNGAQEGQTRTGSDGRKYKARKPRKKKSADTSGGSSESNGHAGGGKKPARNGSEVFDMKKRWEQIIGPVVRFEDDVCRAHPDEKQGQEHRTYHRCVEDLFKAVERWEKKVKATKKARAGK